VPCSLVEVYRRFRGACCLHHQGALMMEAYVSQVSSTFQLLTKILYPFVLLPYMLHSPPISPSCFFHYWSTSLVPTILRFILTDQLRDSVLHSFPNILAIYYYFTFTIIIIIIIIITVYVGLLGCNTVWTCTRVSQMKTVKLR
jgi:hypothetical protein